MLGAVSEACKKFSVFKCNLFLVLFISGVLLQTNDTGILNSETQPYDSSPSNYHNSTDDEVELEIVPAVNEGRQPAMNESVSMDGFEHVDASSSDVPLYAVGKFAHCFNLPNTCRTPSFLDVIFGCKEFGQFQSGEFEYVPVTPGQFNAESIFDVWLCSCLALNLGLLAYITIVSV